jgi:MFS family permease
VVLSLALALVSMVMIGVGYSVTASLIPAVIGDRFRGSHFGSIFGTLQVANALGGSLGPWVAGRIFDVTGSYRIALAAGLGSGSPRHRRHVEPRPPLAGGRSAGSVTYNEPVRDRSVPA